MRQVQSALRDKGYYYGPIDGVMGPETEAAIRAYQRDNNLPETGQLN